MPEAVFEARYRFREILESEVRRTGAGACVYVPKRWLGKRVAVILLEDEEDTKKATPERRERKGEQAKG